MVDFDGFHGRVGEISITRAFPVEITADGSTQTVMVTGGTVGDAMDQVGLSIDSDDLINYRPGKPVEEGDRIVIQRVEYTTVTEESDIPYETITKSTSLIPNGRTRVLTRGRTAIRSPPILICPSMGCLKSGSLWGRISPSAQSPKRS